MSVKSEKNAAFVHDIKQVNAFCVIFARILLKWATWAKHVLKKHVGIANISISFS